MQAGQRQRSDCLQTGMPAAGRPAAPRDQRKTAESDRPVKRSQTRLRRVRMSRGVTPKILERSTVDAASADSSCRDSVCGQRREGHGAPGRVGWVCCRRPGRKPHRGCKQEAVTQRLCRQGLPGQQHAAGGGCVGHCKPCAAQARGPAAGAPARKAARQSNSQVKAGKAATARPAPTMDSSFINRLRAVAWRSMPACIVQA